LISSHLKASNNFSAKKANFFNFAKHLIPHPEKRHKGGEDACFVNDKLLSVADGVGGWAEHGVDPGLYSKALCKHIGQIFESDDQKYR